MQKKTLEIGTWSVVLFIIIIYTIRYFMETNHTKAFMGILTLVLLIVLAFWQKYSGLRFPVPFITLIYFFIFAAIGLGTFGGFYKIPYYDDFLHFISGIMSGYAAWYVLLTLEGKKTVNQLSQKFLLLYMIAFVLAVAGFWELLEFAGDSFFNFTAQGRGHVDTMTDMLDGLLGGIIFCIGFFYRRKNKRLK